VTVANRNVDKGREAENAVARVLQAHGMPHAERRTKRGGTVTLPCPDCDGHVPRDELPCMTCGGLGATDVPADAGDITGIPGVVVQVKWSPYKPLAEDMRRTDEQRRVANADVGLLVRKRPRVGLARAGEWDAYLPQWAVAYLMQTYAPHAAGAAVWGTDLATAARLLAGAGYGTPNRHETQETETSD
jgi:hypothetical protein